LSRRLVPLTLDNLDDLPGPCRACAFWELDPLAAERAQAQGDLPLEKEAWVSDTLLEWGSCGQLIYVDSVPAGYVLFAPAAYVPRSVAFPTSPPSPDAVLLMGAQVLASYRGGGLGRMLIQGVARDAARRGIRAIEAFGTRSNTALDPEGCMLPADYLLAVGFKTIRPHPRFPRLRLDMKSTVSWREDVESAFERILSTISAPSLSRG
jgi:GNAT superfamily N-acetyltransferase